MVLWNLMCGLCRFAFRRSQTLMRKYRNLAKSLARLAAQLLHQRLQQWLRLHRRQERRIPRRFISRVCMKCRALGFSRGATRSTHYSTRPALAACSFRRRPAPRVASDHPAPCTQRAPTCEAPRGAHLARYMCMYICGAAHGHTPKKGSGTREVSRRGSRRERAEASSHSLVSLALWLLLVRVSRDTLSVLVTALPFDI